MGLPSAPVSTDEAQKPAASSAGNGAAAPRKPPARPWRERLRAIVPEAIFALLALSTALPLWLVTRPPLQDLPQHVAAVQVMAHFGDDALRYSETLTVELWRTQYLAFYLVCIALAWVLPALTAVKVVLTASLVATPYALRAVLQALRSDGWLAILVLPLLWNAHLILGFLNFIAAIPLALFALALAIRIRTGGFTRGRAAGLGALTLICFYTHVVPFGLLLLACFAVGLSRDWRAMVRYAVPFVPALVATGVWMLTSPAGQSTLQAASLEEGERAAPVYAPFSHSLAELPSWMLDVLPGDADDQLFVVWLILAGAAVLWGRPLDHGLARDLRARLVIVPLAALFAYFVTPVSYDWIWPINARFPLLAAIFGLTVLRPIGPRVTRGALLAATALLTLVCVETVSVASLDFAEETGELDEALGSIPRGSRVVGLMFDRQSAHVRFAPYIHAAAWAQAARGGAAMFTFADFPQSPIRFRDDDRPPPVPPRWEWEPQRVTVEQLGWYEFALMRGGPGRLGRAPGVEPVFRGPVWSVWKLPNRAP